jgi:thiol:disulfide interchange protein
MRNLLPTLGSALAVALCLSLAANKLHGQATTAQGNGLMDFQLFVVTQDGRQKADGAPIKVRRNELIKLVIEGKIKNKRYHTYPVTGQPAKNSIVFGKANGLHLNDLIRETPAPGDLPFHENERIHNGPYILEQEFYVAEDAAPGVVKMPVTLDGSVCDDSRCFKFDIDRQIDFDILSERASNIDPSKLKLNGNTQPKLIGQTPRRLSTKDPKEESKEIIYGTIATTQETYKEMMEHLRSSGAIINETISKFDPAADLWAFLLGGIFWGMISLVTPCVFPMIPITVSIFLKQSEKEHHKPLLMAAVYSGTIVIVLSLAATLLLKVFREMSVNPYMNYGLGALFVFFALSLFGMYDIELPSGLARFTSAHEGQGGIVGTMFMALTFTIISFACVAPFLGGFGGTAAGVDRPLWGNLLGGLAFSATFAAPFFFLALFPTLLRKLPKSGSWLNSVKVVMGFLELAAAIKFCRSAELVMTGGDTWLFTFDLTMGVYVALALVAGLYLLGVFRLPHDSPAEHLSVPGMVVAGMFISLGLYLAPALIKTSSGDNIRPRGSIYSWVEAFLLPDASESLSDEPHTPRLDAAVAKSLEKYRSDLVKAKDLSKEDQAKILPQRIFVDFTGENCTNCRINERSVFSKRLIRELMEPYLVVKLYTDVIPYYYYSSEARSNLTVSRQKADARVNLAFQSNIFNNQQLPLYAILEPQFDGRIKVLSVYDEGRIINENAFAEFLRDPK